MRMKSELFMHEMTETSAVFGRKAKTRVTFGGNGAYTDGTHINLPAMAQGKEIDDVSIDVMRGYTDHEAGHIRHTNFKEVKKFVENECTNPDGSFNNLLKSLGNAVEDVWLERKVLKEYPGSWKNLSAVASAVNGEFKDMKDADKIAKDWMAVLPVALTWEGRKDYKEIKNNDDCLNMLDDDLRERLKDWVKEINGCKSTKDNHKLAKKIHDEVMEEAEKRKPEPEDKKGDGEGGGTPDQDPPHGDEANKGDGDEKVNEDEKDTTVSEQLEGEESQEDEGSDGKGKGSPDGEEDGDKEDQPDGGSGADDAGDKEDGDKPEDKGDEDTVGATGSWGEHEIQTGDLSNAVDAIISKSESLKGDGSDYKVMTTKDDLVITRHHPKRKLMMPDDEQHGRDEYERKLRGMTGAPNVIRRKLERALSAKMNRGWEGGREQGKLDTKRLVSAFNGKPDVYKERDPVPEIDTATTILIDCSGSMSGSKIRLANEIAIALAEALERTTVSYEILGFTDRSIGWKRFYREKVKGKEPFSRVEGLLHYVFKDYNESLLRAKPALGGIHCYADRRENVDGEAIQWASRRLLKRHEKRKVMLVLSDGLPAFACSRAGGYEDYDLMGADAHCRYAVDEAIKSGIDMIGIGIQDSSVKKFYPDHVVVRNLDDLQKTVISKLAKALLGERYEVDNSELMKVRDAVA